jgi:hypothetical protein
MDPQATEMVNLNNVTPRTHATARDTFLFTAAPRRVILFALNLHLTIFL